MDNGAELSIKSNPLLFTIPKSPHSIFKKLHSVARLINDASFLLTGRCQRRNLVAEIHPAPVAAAATQARRRRTGLSNQPLIKIFIYCRLIDCITERRGSLRRSVKIPPPVTSVITTLLVPVVIKTVPLYLSH